MTDDPRPLTELREDVDTALSDLVAAMMAKVPEERPSYDRIIGKLTPLADEVEGPLLEDLRRRSTDLHLAAVRVDFHAGPRRRRSRRPSIRRPR